jgi:hypothetical protein
MSRKISRSVNFDPDVYATIEALSRTRAFNKNFSKALNWVIRSLMKPARFYAYMARYHCSMMNFFSDLREQTKGKPAAHDLVDLEQQEALSEKSL